MLDSVAIQTNLDDVRAVIRRCVEAMPRRQAFIDQTWAAPALARAV